MTCKKNNLFNKKKTKRVQRLLPKIQDICNAKSQRQLKLCFEGLDKQEMDFIAECVYNVIFNADKLLSIDQISFLKTIMNKMKRNVLVSLYQFTFQGMTNTRKVICCCKAYYVVVIVLSMLMPIFKNVLL